MAKTTLRMAVAVLAFGLALTTAGCARRQAAAVLPARAEAAPADLPPVTIIKDAASLKQAVGRYAGKTVVVNFWATWCPPCVEEFPHLAELAREYAAKGVVVLFVSGDLPEDLEGKVKPFLAKHQVKDGAFLLSADDSSKFIDEFEKSWSGAYPATFFFNRKGKLVNQVEGEQTAEQFRKLFDAALAKG